MNEKSKHDVVSIAALPFTIREDQIDDKDEVKSDNIALVFKVREDQISNRDEKRYQ